MLSLRRNIWIYLCNEQANSYFCYEIIALLVQCVYNYINTFTKLKLLSKLLSPYCLIFLFLSYISYKCNNNYYYYKYDYNYILSAHTHDRTRAHLGTTRPHIDGLIDPQIIQSAFVDSRTLPRTSPRNLPCRAEVDDNALLIHLQRNYILLHQSPRTGRRSPQNTSFIQEMSAHIEDVIISTFTYHNYSVIFEFISYSIFIPIYA